MTLGYLLIFGNPVCLRILFAVCRFRILWGTETILPTSLLQISWLPRWRTHLYPAIFSFFFTVLAKSVMKQTMLQPDAHQFFRLRFEVPFLSPHSRKLDKREESHYRILQAKFSDCFLGVREQSRARFLRVRQNTQFPILVLEYQKIWWCRFHRCNAQTLLWTPFSQCLSIKSTSFADP